MHMESGRAGDQKGALYYAVVGPFLRRSARDNEFSYTETSGLGALVLALAILVVMEGIPAHFMIHSWSAKGAWVHAALDGYVLIWTTAAYQAARLRPVTIERGRLLVRASILWTAEIPLATIEAVRPIAARPSGQEVLCVALGAAPNVLLTMNEPVAVRGPFGTRKLVRQIALFVDEPARLTSALV
jgi:hypothetical protein